MPDVPPAVDPEEPFIVGNTVRVGIQAPRSVPVYREEIWHAVRDENRAAADAAPFELPSPVAK